LSAARADVVTPLVNEIMASAVAVGAECLVTSCAMCQLNLELRCTWEPRLPIFHFSEILALALGAQDYEGWFTRHLVDPRPLLQARDLIP
jgi:heterodisulfide reductase subunit B